MIYIKVLCVCSSIYIYIDDIYYNLHIFPLVLHLSDDVKLELTVYNKLILIFCNYFGVHIYFTKGFSLLILVYINNKHFFNFDDIYNNLYIFPLVLLHFNVNLGLTVYIIDIILLLFGGVYILY